jgi:predicted DNA-binding ribbon-helix-helix protein
MRKRSVVIGGHATSISLEDEFWRELVSIAEARNLSLNALIAEIDQARGERPNLSSALRLHVLKALRQKISRA